VNSVTEEVRVRLPKILANLAIALIFFGMSYIIVWTLSTASTEIVYLLQIGLLIATGIFLIRTLLDTLVIIDRATRLFLRSLGIKEGWSRQRVFKDTIYIVAILLVAAATIPLFSRIPTYEPLLQQVLTYSAFALILVFVYDIGRTLYRITEKKANLVADRISNSNETGDRINGK
jgi:cation transport ATPase